MCRCCLLLRSDDNNNIHLGRHFVFSPASKRRSNFFQLLFSITHILISIFYQSFQHILMVVSDFLKFPSDPTRIQDGRHFFPHSFHLPQQVKFSFDTYLAAIQTFSPSDRIVSYFTSAQNNPSRTELVAMFFLPLAWSSNHNKVG